MWFDLRRFARRAQGAGPHGMRRHRGPGGPGGGFGVRRPLRALVERLELDDIQAQQASKVMAAFRLEMAGADLDRKGARARTADLLEADTLDAAALAAAGDVRVAAARRERDAWVAALSALHAGLRPEQRLRLARMLREGPFGG